MSRTLHDEFAKDWMQEFLSDFGTVQTEFPISGEVRSVDVYFEPDHDRFPAPIGQLGRIITTPCLLEPFRNAIPAVEICNCRTKSTILGQNLVRQAKTQKARFRFADRLFLWMISPTLSQRMQQKFCMHQSPSWGDGIYFLPEGDRAAVIAVHQLPETLDTLWLRLLGRDNVQRRAIAELLALPKHHPYRDLSLRHIAVLHKNLKARQNLTKHLREITMSLSITYEQIETKLLQQGREEGREEIARELLREGMVPAQVARLTKLPIATVEGFFNEKLPD
jgi:hypothetical protein